MAEVTTMAGLKTVVETRRQEFDIVKTFTGTTAAGQLLSAWNVPGDPAAGANPGAASVPTNATVGALAAFMDPAGGEFAHLYEYDATMVLNNQGLYLYDRLVHHGGESGTDTTLRTINTPAITRGDTNGEGVVGFVECYTSLGSSPQTLTVSYTNTAGTAGQITTVSIPATLRNNRVILIPLLSGDTGIKSIETIQLGGSTGTAGNYGVTLARRICPIMPPIEAESVAMQGLEIGYPVLSTGACLWLVSAPPSNSPPDVLLSLTITTTG